MKRTLIIDTTAAAGKKVYLQGWVLSRRDHGKLVFIDLHDRSGVLQCLLTESLTFQERAALKVGACLACEATIQKRPKGMKNAQLDTGTVEGQIEKVTLYKNSKPLPFPVDEDGYSIDEETRLKYRYLDLRRVRLTKNMRLRSAAMQFIRNYLTAEDFVEFETPILGKSTPEGARDYLVPARLFPGMFYALPQSPQQHKQLLMIAQFERYFQFARCFRDEDTRGDRQPEFTQLDLELSFTSQDEIMALTEKMFSALVKAIFLEKQLTKKQFFRLTHKEALEQYGTDKPDLRKNTKNPHELAFAWITNWPLFSYDKIRQRWDPYHHIFTAPHDEDIEMLKKNPGKVRSCQHDLVLNGNEVAGGSLRITDSLLQQKIFTLVGIPEADARAEFGHLLEALHYGAPPHGGIAVGFDRLLATLLNEPNIREVIPFPKTGDARDPMMGSPASPTSAQLRDLHLQTKSR